MNDHSDQYEELARQEQSPHGQLRQLNAGNGSNEGQFYKQSVPQDDYEVAALGGHSAFDRQVNANRQMVEASLPGAMTTEANDAQSQRVLNAPNQHLITEEKEEEEQGEAQAINPLSATKQVATDREMVEASIPGSIPTGTVNQTAAGLGALGGARGFGRAARRNPLIMFPQRALRGLTNLFKSIWKWGKKKFGSSRAAPAAAAAAENAAAVGDENKEAQDEKVAEAQQPPPPSISVDLSTPFGKHMEGKAQLRDAMKAGLEPGSENMAVPQGYTDTKFGNANSIAHRMKTGGQVTQEERAYLRLMYSRANAITAKAEDASPENPSSFPFSQRTQADQEDTGAAKAGHFLTGVGGAINDREEVRPEGGAAATAWDVLNVGANAGKAGTRMIDKLLKEKVGVDDQKIVGNAGKAYADTGKALQFTYGFVGKDTAKLYDQLNPGPDGSPGHAGKDLTKELDRYLNIKNLDRIGVVEAEIPGTDGMKYSKNVNAASLGKFVEHPATIAQAAGTGMTEKFGKPFEKMHKKRADLLERQFATTVMRRMLQADRANKDRLIDDRVDAERRGKEAFPNAQAGLLQSVAGESAAALKLGKQAQQSGYASNFGQDMDTTAMLNDKKHQRQYGGEFKSLMRDRNNIRLQSDASKLEEDVKNELVGKDEEDKKRRELAARAIQQFGIRTAYRTDAAARKKAEKKLASLQGKDSNELQEKADEASTEKIQAAAELQWSDRNARVDGADREQWRGLWDERPAMAREQAKLEAERARSNPANAQAAVDEKSEDADPEDMRSDVVEMSEDEKPLIAEEEAPGAAAPLDRNAADNAGPVQGRAVRKNRAGKGVAKVGQGVGKSLSTVGGVIAFDGGENALKAGNLKEAAAKAALSEVYQNFGTAGLAKAPVVGDFAKTVGLGAFTPIGEGLKKVGGVIEEASVGKENRDRLYNKHWGLESQNASDKTRNKRADLRAREAGIAEEIQGKEGEEGSGLKADFFAKAQKLNELKARLAPGDSDLELAQGDVNRAREAVFERIRGLREVEGKLGYSRRRQLARTGLVMPPRAEADFNQPQTPLTEDQIQQHQQAMAARGKSPLSAALPKEVPVYKSKAGAAKDSDMPQISDNAVIEEASEELEDEDKVAGGNQAQIPDMNMDWLQPDFQPDPNNRWGQQPVEAPQQEESDPMKKYAHIFDMKTDKDFDRYMDADEIAKKGKKGRKK